MQGKELIDVLKKVLGITTNRELAPFLGITEARISQLCQQNPLLEQQIDKLLIHAHGVSQKKAQEKALQTAISPLVEFYPLDPTLSRKETNWQVFNAENNRYTAGLKKVLNENHGIYVFFDSMGKSIYVGKAKNQTLWKEMNAAFNRGRGNLQTIIFVDHPSAREFTPAYEKRRKLGEHAVYLSDIATYFSAYSVATDFIDIAESFLIRCFPNNLLNKRMEQGVFGNN